MVDQPSHETPSAPDAPQAPVAAPAPAPRRRFAAWPLLWTVIFLEGVFLGITVAVGVLWGNMALGHLIGVLFVPSFGLVILAFLLLVWRQIALRRSVLGWLLLLVHGCVLCFGVVGAMELTNNPQPYAQRLKTDLSELLKIMASGAVPATMDSTALAPVVPGADTGAAKGVSASLEIPEVLLEPGDSVTVQGAQGWNVVVRRDLHSEAISRAVDSQGVRVELAFPDSGQAWTAAGPVDFIECRKRPWIALTQIGTCAKPSSVDDPQAGIGCDEPVKLYEVAVELHGTRRLAVPSMPDIRRAVIDSVVNWTRGMGCDQ